MVVDTGLCPSGSSESQGSVSGGEPAPILDDALGGCRPGWLQLIVDSDVDGRVAVIATTD